MATLSQLRHHGEKRKNSSQRRIGSIADDLLSLHASDPVLVPEANMRFALSVALVARAEYSYSIKSNSPYRL